MSLLIRLSTKGRTLVLERWLDISQPWVRVKVRVRYILLYSDPRTDRCIKVRRKMTTHNVNPSCFVFQDDNLRKLVQRIGTGDWKYIASFLPVGFL